MKYLHCVLCSFNTVDSEYWQGMLAPGKICPSCYNGQMAPMDGMNPSTQKSRGLLALMGQTSLAVLRILHLAKVKEPIEIPALLKSWFTNGAGVFARPCPPTPQHGFVESRVVKTEEDIELLRLE